MSEAVSREHYTDEPWQRTVSASLRAAYAWSVRGEHRNTAMREIARMTGIIMEVQGPGRGPVTPADLVKSLGQPLGGLLPKALDWPEELAEVRLLSKDGRLTPQAYDLVCEHVVSLKGVFETEGWLPTWVTMHSDQIRQRTFTAMIATRKQDEYVATRRFLVEHPAGSEEELVKLRDEAGSVRLPWGGYRGIPEEQLFRDEDGRGWWWPCRECRWPMGISTTGKVRCRYRPHGAVYDVVTGSRPALRRKDEGPRSRKPVAQAAEGARCVDAGVWRFVVVPGVSELRIAAAAERAGAEVALWPYLDRFDLLVSAGGEEFSVDVKEHLSLSALIERLRTRPPSARVLLPKSCEWQWEPVKKALRGLSVTTEAKFLAQIRTAVRKAR